MKIALNENNHHRGLHIVIFNHSNANILDAASFDTYESSTLFEQFISTRNIPEGAIIAAACKDDCVRNLS